MSPPITFITSHLLDGRESKASNEEQRRFAEFVTANQPRLLDFQAYVSEDKRQLKLFFVFPETGGIELAPVHPEPDDQGFRDSALAGLLAGAAIVVLFLAAVYVGSVGASLPA
jgi:hypothetical protein